MIKWLMIKKNLWLSKIYDFFSFFIISIINPLISYDGGTVYCLSVSERRHAVETRVFFRSRDICFY